MKQLIIAMLLSSVNVLLPLFLHSPITAAAEMDNHPQSKVRDFDIAIRPSAEGLTPIVTRGGLSLQQDNVGFPWRRCTVCIWQCIAYTAVCGAVCFGGEVIPFAGLEACLVGFYALSIFQYRARISYNPLRLV